MVTVRTVQDRFWSKVLVGADSECWPWTGARQTSGYGSFRLDGKRIGAHRVAYAMATGIWPQGRLVIMHLCGHKWCTNPAHLQLGTAQQNVQMYVKEGI